MHTFIYNGNPCISINGKDYFLVRGYSRSSFFFVQVSGTTPLRKEDMPSKDWNIVVSRAGKDRVWTAYKRPYFQYQTEREHPALAFVGLSPVGSHYLALKFLAERYHLRLDNEQILAAARYYQNEDHLFEQVRDQGYMDVKAVVIDFGGWRWPSTEEKRETKARELFAGALGMDLIEA